MKIYTKTGDEGKTGLLYGGRVWKDDPGPEAYGAVDEAVSALGVARADATGELAAEILALERDLFVVGAELATDPANREKLTPNVSLTTSAMVERLEGVIDTVVEEHPLPQEFVVPGENALEAALEVARATVRRAERRVISYARAGGLDGSVVPIYLNRLADLLYVLARSTAATWQPTRPKEDT
ncbi:MAG: cob(I)yrinic acid a,c-diamide adenosyltransferase [Acidimicrobiia bacterium]|nr:cob(I)yrinic acid a,c-diamide adenosyltransferase [Acidimicrobiia bacterium]MBT8246665.1 cob(I)yrinic acid a,c-diamide adenosyltransferase [Acidimicrobiia bacterium]NNF89234.1 cob(I)yrinic acid a,c-diamide adenosyltransferase [Acidimicrobiia bacterium]NNJ47311.1 cob(I)yrinic acid a,c-diamide adenosyltransferase [Acidimicrobiia bacterium]NNL12297.1 cob(I)yrinic acid a,c-diamide adenosyltransferase [Acidimicrobiia bacterium]